MARKRNLRIEIRVDEDEKKIIREKMKAIGTNSYTDMFILGVCRLKYYKVDMTPIFELKYSIDKIGTNINQIAKVINSNQAAYKNDILELQKQIDNINKIVNEFSDLIHQASKGYKVT